MTYDPDRWIVTPGELAVIAFCAVVFAVPAAALLHAACCLVGAVVRIAWMAIKRLMRPAAKDAPTS